MAVYRTKFERINFCFDPPVKQSSDVVFECDVPNDDEHYAEFNNAALAAMHAQNPHWNESDPFPIEGYGGWSSIMGGHKFEEVVDVDLDFDLGVPGDSPIPRIAETFKKKGWQDLKYASDRNLRYRVTGFYKTWVPKSFKRTLTDDLLDEIKAEERAGMTPRQLDSITREIKIISCSREEAEFISGTGVGGSILRVEDVEVVGMVTWDYRTIARARRDYKPERDEWPITWHRYWDA